MYCIPWGPIMYQTELHLQSDDTVASLGLV